MNRGVSGLLRVSRRNYLAESYSVVKANGPVVVANRAVPFDRVPAAEQSLQFRESKMVLWLFALAMRARRGKDDCVTHAAPK